MAQPANTFDRYDLAADGDNVREDLSNTLYLVSPTEVPIQTNIGMSRTKNDYTEWLEHTLPASSDNAHIDGDDFAADPVTSAARLGNFCQIGRRDFTISDRAEIVNKAGRRSEIGFTIARNGKALRIDVEIGLTLRKAAAKGSSSAAPKAASIPSWIRTHDNLGASGSSPTLSGGTDGYPNAAGTVGTARALTEAMILNAGEAVYTGSTGAPNALFVHPKVKQSLSAYLFTNSSARIATQYQEQGRKPRGGVMVVGAVDVYVNDFQVIDIVPSRFIAGTGGTSRDVLLLDTSYWQMCYLRPYRTQRIATSGDSHKRMMLVDWTVKAFAESANATIAAITDSAAVTAG